MFSPIIIKKGSLLLWNGTLLCKRFTHSILSEFSALQPTDHTNFSLIFQHFIANSLPAFKYSSFLILKLFNIPTNPYVPLQQQIFFFFHLFLARSTRWWISFFWLFLKNLNWRISALQNFVIFFHTSTRLSHSYTRVPSLSELPPISLPTPAFSLSQSPYLSSLFPPPLFWVLLQIPIGYLVYTWCCKFLLLCPYTFPSLSSSPTLSIGLFSMSVSPLPPWK